MDDSFDEPQTPQSVRSSVIEFDFISSVLHDTTQFREVSDVTPNMFGDANLRTVWSYMYDKGGKVTGSVMRSDIEKHPALKASMIDMFGFNMDEAIDSIYQRGRHAGRAENLSDSIRNASTLRMIEVAQAQLVPGNFRDATEWAMALSTRISSIASSMAPNVNPQALSQGVDQAYEGFLWRQANPGKFQGLRIGIPDYDAEMNGLQDGELILVGGHSGEGKTQLKACMALKAARTPRDNTGVPPKVAFFSLEMTPREMAARWISNLAGVSMNEPHPDKQQLLAIKRAVKELKELSDSRHLMIFDQPMAHTLEQIVRTLHRCKEEDDIGIAFVDYAGLIKVGGSGDVSKYDQMATLAQRLKHTANQLGIPIVLGVQLNRDGLTNSAAGRPKLIHIADSMDLVRSADGVQMIWTPARHLNGGRVGPWKGIAAILTEKVRSRPQIDPLYFLYDPSTNSFNTLSDEVKQELRSADSQDLLSGAKKTWDPKKAS